MTLHNIRKRGLPFLAYLKGSYFFGTRKQNGSKQMHVTLQVQPSNFVPTLYFVLCTVHNCICPVICKHDGVRFHLVWATFDNVRTTSARTRGPNSIRSNRPVGINDGAILGSFSGDPPQLAAAQPLLHTEITLLCLVAEPAGKSDGCEKRTIRWDA